MQLRDTQVRANSARATPHEDQELIRTLDLSLLARKNSFWSFAIRQRQQVFDLRLTIFERNKSFDFIVTSNYTHRQFQIQKLEMLTTSFMA